MNAESRRPVVLVSSDLMFTSRATSTAEMAGAVLTVAANPEAALQQVENYEQPLVVADLTLSGLDIAQFAEELRRVSPESTCIAYGPHVQVGRLNAAKAAGCQVLTRGQFDAQMGAILTQATRP